jgi:hypothetical protein
LPVYAKRESILGMMIQIKKKAPVFAGTSQDIFVFLSPALPGSSFEGLFLRVFLCNLPLNISFLQRTKMERIPGAGLTQFLEKVTLFTDFL